MEDDDSDIKLQRDSASIINDLEASIPLFLYRDPQADEPIRIRKWVKQSNTAKLESMVSYPCTPWLVHTLILGHSTCSSMPSKNGPSSSIPPFDVTLNLW